MKKTKPCRRCGDPAVAKGVVYRLLWSKDLTRPPKKRSEQRWMCMRHYLECQFGLWPYTCTKQCEKVRRKASDCAQLSESEFLTWISLDIIASTRTLRPKCPWCDRKLRPYPPKPTATKATASELKTV